MLGRLLYSLAVVVVIFAAITVPYYLVIHSVPVEEYKDHSKFLIWITGALALGVMFIGFMILMYIIKFFVNWIGWVITGVWGEKPKPGENTNMEY